VTKAEPHKWEFKARFRRHPFGWKSQPAIQRIKQAVAERTGATDEGKETIRQMTVSVHGGANFVGQVFGRELGLP
jgi:hypothetical protein